MSNQHLQIAIISIAAGLVLTILIAQVLPRQRTYWKDGEYLCESANAGLTNETAYGYPLSFRTTSMTYCGGSSNNWSYGALLADVGMASAAVFGVAYTFKKSRTSK